MYRVNPASLILNFVQQVELALNILQVCLLNTPYHIKKKNPTFVQIQVICAWFYWASLWVYWLLPLGTLSLGRCFYGEKSCTSSYFSPNPYVACEGVKHTTHKQPNWEPCVCLSAFPGARTVCAGSEEARALIKEQAWYRDASLTAWGTCNLMGSRWEPPDWTSFF